MLILSPWLIGSVFGHSLDCVLAHFFFITNSRFLLQAWAVDPITLAYWECLWPLSCLCTRSSFFLSRTVVSYCRFWLLILSPWLIGSAFGHSLDCVPAHL